MSHMLEAVEHLLGEHSYAQAEALEAYCGLVRQVGARWNIMAQGELHRVEEHVVDSAALLRVYDRHEALVADLGSGAGLPGVVLAVLRPSWRVALVDSRRSKAVFLREAVRALQLRNVVVVHNRIEGLESGAFDMATSRALGSIEITLGCSLKVVSPGGKLVLFKGPRWKEERPAAIAIAKRAGATLASEVDVELPGLDRKTTFVVFRCEAEGPGV